MYSYRHGMKRGHSSFTFDGNVASPMMFAGVVDRWGPAALRRSVGFRSRAGEELEIGVFPIL